MEGIKDSNGDQDIFILDENQPVDDSVVAQRVRASHAVASASSGASVSLCECLKNAREVRRLDIKTVASNLKIKPEQLEALEAGDVEAFPRFYALGFLRTYAGYLGEEALGFSAEEAVARFKEERQQFKKAQSFSFPAAITEARLPQASVIVASGLAAMAIYGFWLALAGPSYDEANAVPHVPVNLTAAESPVQGFGPVVVNDGAVDNSISGEVRSEPESALAVAGLAPTAGRDSDEAEERRGEERPLAVQKRSVAFRATQDAWVRIVPTGELPIIEGVLRAGESVAAPAQGEVEIKTANPRALELLVDGELVGSVGDDDEVHQLISLDIGRLVKQTVQAN